MLVSYVRFFDKELSAALRKTILNMFFKNCSVGVNVLLPLGADHGNKVE